MRPNIRWKVRGYRLQSYGASSTSFFTRSLQRNVGHWSAYTSGCTQKKEKRETIWVFKMEGIKSKNLVTVLMKEGSNVCGVTDSCSYLCSSLLKLLWLQAIPVSGAATAIDYTTSLPAFTTSHQHLSPTKGTSEHLPEAQLYVHHNIMGEFG